MISNLEAHLNGGKYHENGDDRDTLFTDLGVFENFNPSIHTSNKNASWLFLANIHPSLQLSVLEQCTNAPLVVTDTMNLWIDSTPEELKKLSPKLIFYSLMKASFICSQKNKM